MNTTALTGSRAVRAMVISLALAGCAGNAGLPRFRTARPAPLPRVGALPADHRVRVELEALPWWTIAGTDRAFVLGFDEPAGPPTAGRRVGPVRSRDVMLAEHELDLIRCAWKIVPMGDPRPCPEMRRVDAMVAARPFIDRARADLRAQSRRAGAGVVAGVRCFAEHSRRFTGGHLWCEGVAVVPSGDEPAPPVAVIEPDPAAPIDREPRLTGTRLVLHADGSAGMLGGKPIVGSTLGLRYRPFEIGFYILDLQRESVAPMDGGLVGLGVTGLGRFALGHTRADAIAGLSALAVARNGATNPDFDGLYQGFVGLAYQTPWRIAGVAQPFVQLRAGVAHGATVSGMAAPMVELHLGLSSPERR